MPYAYLVRLAGQAYEDDEPIPISGKSGRSVRTIGINVAIYTQWIWTAPVTGPVTFDTLGSDFAVLLTAEVRDDDNFWNVAIDGNAMRFIAQQDQSYKNYCSTT